MFILTFLITKTQEITSCSYALKSWNTCISLCSGVTSFQNMTLSGMTIELPQIIIVDGLTHAFISFTRDISYTAVLMFMFATDTQNLKHNCQYPTYKFLCIDACNCFLMVELNIVLEALRNMLLMWRYFAEKGRFIVSVSIARYNLVLCRHASPTRQLCHHH